MSQQKKTLKELELIELLAYSKNLQVELNNLRLHEKEAQEEIARRVADHESKNNNQTAS